MLSLPLPSLAAAGDAPSWVRHGRAKKEHGLWGRSGSSTVSGLGVEPGAKVIAMVVASENKNGLHLMLTIFVVMLRMNV